MVIKILPMILPVVATNNHATLNPYPVFFGTITESDLWKKNPKSSLVTSQLGLRQWKLYVQIQCQLGYLMILISNGICQYEGKYAALKKNICHFLGPSPSVISGKKIHSTETYTNWFNAALWIFFSAKHARWWSRVLDFFSRIHG